METTYRPAQDSEGSTVDAGHRPGHPFADPVPGPVRVHDHDFPENAGPVLPAERADLAGGVRPNSRFRRIFPGAFTVTVNKVGTTVEETVDLSAFAGQTLDLYTVPQEDGSKKDMVLLKGISKGEHLHRSEEPDRRPDLPGTAARTNPSTGRGCLPRLGGTTPRCGTRSTTRRCCGTRSSTRSPRPSGC